MKADVFSLGGDQLFSREFDNKKDEYRNKSALWWVR